MCEGQCLRDRQRGHAVAIHGGEQLGVPGQASIGPLRSQQKLQAVLHRQAMFPFEVRVPGAHEREQGQGGDAGIGVGPGIAAVLSLLRRASPGSVAAGAPASIGFLIGDQPSQGQLHRGFGIGIAARRFHRG